MNSTFVRFLKNKGHLLNDISDGFELREHPIKFKPSMHTVLPSLLDLWMDKKVSSSVISPIVKKYNELDRKSFWNWFVDEMKNNQIFNLNVNYITTQINDAKIKMKCFTELRDNQRLHANHRNWFGDYGIALTEKWIKKNSGDRIIYVDNDSEITNRIGRLMSMLFSVVDGKDVIKSVFDVLSFTEIEGNSHEYEWRIVGNHNFAGASYGNYPNTISFSTDDIVAIYVENEQDVEQFVKALTEKKKQEGSTNIPQVILSEKIYLSDEEVKEIDDIHARRN